MFGLEAPAFENELGSYRGSAEPMKVTFGTDALLSAAISLDIGLGCGLPLPGQAPPMYGNG